MKKLILIGWALLLGCGGWAQGTLNFANGASGVNAPVSYLGTFVSGNEYVADLFYGPQGSLESSLAAIGADVTFGTGANAGYFFGGERTIPGQTGTVTVQVRVWRVADGSTYEQAVGNGGVYGKSNLFDVTLATGGAPPPSLVGLQPQFTLVPEPSIFALGMLGVGAFLMRGTVRINQNSSQK